MGEYRKAADLYSRLLAHDELGAAALSIKGLALMNLGDLDGGRSSLYRAIEANPESELTWHNKCILRLESGDYHGALECCENAMRYRSVSAHSAVRAKDVNELSNAFERVDLRDAAYINLPLDHPVLRAEEFSKVSIEEIAKEATVIVEYRCPVCGNMIGQSDLLCSLCGTAFVEGEDEIKEIVDVTDQTH